MLQFSIVFSVLTIAVATSSECPFLGTPKNGFAYESSEIIDATVARAYKFEDVIDFECNSTNWDILSTVEQETVCESSGQWSNPKVPKCLRKYQVFNRQASKAGNCSRTLRLDFFQPDEQQFLMNDVREIRVFLCKEVQYGLPLDIKWTSSQKRGKCQPKGDVKRHYFCSIDSVDNENIEHIQIDARVEHSVEQITLLADTGDYCGSPAHPMNGGVDLDSDGQYKYKCNEGFYLDGNEEAHCTPKTGEWDPVPICRPKVFASSTAAPSGALDRTSKTWTSKTWTSKTRTEMMLPTSTDMSIAELQASSAAAFNSKSLLLVVSLWAASHLI